MPTTAAIRTPRVNIREYVSLPSRVMCQPQEKTSRAPGRAWSSTACAVPDAYCRTPQGTRTVSTPSQPSTARRTTSGSSVGPGTTVIRSLNAASFGTLRSRHTPTTSYPRSSASRTMYCPSFPEAPMTQTLLTRSVLMARSPFAGMTTLWCKAR